MGNWLSDIFGGGDSQVSDVNYPDWYSDPKFTGSQDFLDQYSRDLLNNGPNDYYAPIGEYGTPEFLNFLQQGNSATISGVDEELARRGASRGGQAGQIAAQNIGDNNAKLLYADYLRAMKGRQDFFNTGLNVQENVRDAGFKNQGAKNDFNVGGANFDYNKAVYGDAYDRQQGQDIGAMIGGLAPLAGAGIGFMAGGPAGAMTGYQIGSSLGGGDGTTTPAWLSSIMGSKGSKSADVPTGVSTLGRINPDDFLKQYSQFGFGG